MKKLFILLLMLTGILIAQQDKFIIGSEHVSSLQEFWGCQLPHTSDLWDNVEEFGLNYVGLKYFQEVSFSKSQIISELDAAEGNNLKVFLYNGFDHYDLGNNRLDPKRWLYQVEEIGTNNVDFLNLNTGSSNNIDPNALTHWDLAHPTEPQYNFLRLVPGSHSYGLVASDLREKELQPDGLNYYLKIRMRLPVATSYPAVGVLNVRVKKTGGSTLGETILASEFAYANNGWKEIEVKCFNKTINGPVDCIPNIDETTVYKYPDSIGTNQIENYVIKDGVASTAYDIEIEWLNTGYTVDIDYVAVDDENANNLFAGVWDDRIEDAVVGYGNHPAVLNIQAHDEVPVSHLYTTRQINTVMKETQGIGNTIPMSYHYWTPITSYNTLPPVTKRYLWETGMEVLSPFVYPFNYGDNFTTNYPGGTVYPDDPNPNYYNEYVQSNRFNLVLIPALADYIDFATEFGKPFWFVPQAHKWYKWDYYYKRWQKFQREPSPYEIKAMSNLAICYGAKGIIYYLFSTKYADRDSINGFYYYDNSTPRRREADTYGYPKWDVIKDYNHQLALIGDELLSLKWQYLAWSINNGQPTSGYITNVQSLNNSVPDPQGETYVELSEFRKEGEETNDNLEYFFVVNRRTYVDPNTLTGDSRDIRIQYDKSSSNPNDFHNWTVKEVGTSNYWSSASPANEFTTTYQPGDGKLFKLQPTVMSGGDLLYDETISSDIELHGNLVIESGVTLTVNADYYCNGNITIKDGGYLKSTGNGKLFFNNHTQIIAEGTAIIVGQPANKLELDFVEPHHTNGIKVVDGGELAIYYSVIKNPRNGITVESGATLIEIAEVDFENCSDCCITIAGPGSSNCSIHYNTFTNSNCAVSAVNLSDIYIAYNSMQGIKRGIFLSNVTNPLIKNNTIAATLNQMPGIFLESCNGAVRENIINGYTNGLQLGNSSPDIGGNEITNNLYHGIYIGVGSLPKMDARLYSDPLNYYPVAGYNQIWENGGTTTGGPVDNDGSEIYFNNSNADMQKGCNSIYDDREGSGEHPPYNTRLLMNGTSIFEPIHIKAGDNFWSDNPQYLLEERFGNLLVDYEPFFEEPCEVPGESGGEDELFVKSSTGEIIDTLYPVQRTIGNLSDTDLLYAVAEGKFITADYIGAEEIFNQIVNGSDSLEVKFPAYSRLYDIGKLSSKPESYFNNLNNVYTSLLQSTNDSLMINIFSQLGSLSLVGEEEYIQAIDKFDEIIQQNPGSEKAVYAEIDALTTALLIEGTDSTLQKGRLGKYLIKSSGEYNQRVGDLLMKHFGNGEKETGEEIIPTEYTLYQNYPNPFNPTTTIKYDLPNTSEVSLIIYDILGRKVKELVNTKQQAGRYEIQFNASNLASGVYIYQLIAEKFISSKKMILLR